MQEVEIKEEILEVPGQELIEEQSDSVAEVKSNCEDSFAEVMKTLLTMELRV